MALHSSAVLLAAAVIRASATGGVQAKVLTSLKSTVSGIGQQGKVILSEKRADFVKQGKELLAEQRNEIVKQGKDMIAQKRADLVQQGRQLLTDKRIELLQQGKDKVANKCDKWLQQGKQLLADKRAGSHHHHHQQQQLQQTWLQQVILPSSSTPDQLVFIDYEGWKNEFESPFLSPSSTDATTTTTTTSSSSSSSSSFLLSSTLFAHKNGRHKHSPDTIYGVVEESWTSMMMVVVLDILIRPLDATVNTTNSTTTTTLTPSSSETETETETDTTQPPSTDTTSSSSSPLLLHSADSLLLTRFFNLVTALLCSFRFGYLHETKFAFLRSVIIGQLAPVMQQLLYLVDHTSASSSVATSSLSNSTSSISSISSSSAAAAAVTMEASTTVESDENVNSIVDAIVQRISEEILQRKDEALQAIKQSALFGAEVQTNGIEEGEAEKAEASVEEEDVNEIMQLVGLYMETRLNPLLSEFILFIRVVFERVARTIALTTSAATATSNDNENEKLEEVKHVLEEELTKRCTQLRQRIFVMIGKITARFKLVNDTSPSRMRAFSEPTTGGESTGVTQMVADQ